MTGPRFHLDVTTKPGDAVVRLRLQDDDGRHLAGHAVRLADHSPAMWEGLFDTRAHVARYAGGTRFTAEPATPEDLLARLGVFLGRDVLGSELTALLHKGIGRRTLVVRLPATDDATAIDEPISCRVPSSLPCSKSSTCPASMRRGCPGGGQVRTCRGAIDQLVEQVRQQVSIGLDDDAKGHASRRM